jgi:hypothetical protein
LCVIFSFHKPLYSNHVTWDTPVIFHLFVSTSILMEESREYKTLILRNHMILNFS